MTDDDEDDDDDSDDDDDDIDQTSFCGFFFSNDLKIHTQAQGNQLFEYAAR
jgi:hypothetical protein